MQKSRDESQKEFLEIQAGIPGAALANIPGKIFGEIQNKNP